MIRWTKLNPNERALVESPVNRYKIAGPGRVVLTPRQRIIARLYVGPRANTLEFDQVRTAEEIALGVKVQVIYRVDPELFTDDLLSKLAGLNEGGWQGIIHWQTEYVLRMLVGQYPWRELSKEQTKKRLERQFTQTLAARLKIVGLNVIAVCLIKTTLPANLQTTLIRAEQDSIEAGGRALVLKNYLEIFGDNLPQAMPYIIQWELMNTIHKNNPQILMTATHSPAPPTLSEPVFQLQLPIAR